jgi:hypothetical protein
MRTGTGPRLASTFARAGATALGVRGAAAAIFLITEYHIDGGGPGNAWRRLHDEDMRTARITPIKNKNTDTSRKPKEFRQWPMLH